jgi:DNA gyrase subunit B
MRAAKVLKVNDDRRRQGRRARGLTAVVTVRLAEPQFEGQTKEILGTPAARTVVRKVVSSELKTFLTSTKRAEKARPSWSWRRSPAPPRPASPLAAQGDPAPQERAGVLGAAGQAGRLPQQRRRPHRAVHRRG